MQIIANTAFLVFFVILIFFFPSLRAQDEPIKNTHQTKMVGAPIIAYSPETSWQFGLGTKLLFRIQKDSIPTRTSYVAFSARYTMFHQIIFNPNYLIFFNEEKFMLVGEAGYMRFPQHYFGIGNNTPEENLENFSMQSVKLEQILYRNIYRRFFMGLGYRYFNAYDLEFKKGGVLQRERPPGFRGSVSSGIMLSILWDSRDNVLNPTHGESLEITSSFHGSYLGGNTNFAYFLVDGRKYIKLFQERNDVIAFQAYGYFSSSATPFTEMAVLGGDRMMRGYYRGRYRDNHIFALQAEYRLPVYGRFGMTFFGGIGDVSSGIRDFTFTEIKPSCGAGLRFLVSREDNLNIRFDYAIGKGAANFYLNIAEAF